MIEAAPPADAAIRGAVGADAAAIADVARRSFVETFAAYNTAADMALYVAEAFAVERIERELAAPEAVFFVAVNGSRLIGFAKLRTGAGPPPNPGEDAIELERLYVERLWHGRGVAARLMDAVLDESGRRSCRRVWLGVWEHNARAKAFYEKFGFHVVGAKPFLLGTDLQTDLIMQKVLIGA
jgi:diamine N-acetyltransferase